MKEKMREKVKTFYLAHKKVIDSELILFVACWYPGALLAGFMTQNAHPTRNIFEWSFLHLLTGAAVGGGVLLFLIANGIYLYFKYEKPIEAGEHDPNRNFSFSSRGTYGTGGFMQKEDILKVLHELPAEKTDEVILGRDEETGNVFTIPNDAMTNRHIAVYGGSGSRKTRGFVRPYALQAMKRGSRLIVSFQNSQAMWRSKNLAKVFLEKNHIQYGERKDETLVIPIWEADKVASATTGLGDNTILIPELSELGAQGHIEHGESMVFTDPKGELYESLAPLLAEEGYDVKILDIKDANGMRHSDSWNCLAEIEGDDLNAQIFADTIIKNTSNGAKQDFWGEGEMNLLKALCLYVERSQDIPTEMGEVYNLITKHSPTELDAMFNALPYNDDTAACKLAYSVYSQGPDNAKGGMVIGLGSRLQVFQGRTIRDITAHNEIELKALGQRKCAYFCVTSDQHSAFDFLAALFYSMLFVKLVGFADSKGFQRGSSRECWVPVDFCLDEFPNIAQITDFTKKISTVRSRAINISVIFQLIPQLQNRYPYGQWEEILGNCDTNLFLGCNDETTAKYVSEKTDIATVAVSTHATQRHMGQILEPWEYKENASDGKRAVLNPGEVLRLPADNELIFLKGQKVIQCQKFDYTMHPDAARMRGCSINDHIPAWRAAQESKQATEQTKAIPRVDPIPVRQAPKPVPVDIPNIPSTAWKKPRPSSHSQSDSVEFHSPLFK